MILCVMLGAIACEVKQPPSSEEAHYKGKRIMIVHSYHEDLEGVRAKDVGLKEIFKEAGVDHEFFYMDTKRNRKEEFIRSAALLAKAEIERYKPDAVVAFDDNAIKYLIQPYFKDSELPVIFVGIDWDASVYGLPYSNTTGMVSVALVPQMLDYIRKYSAGEKIAWLGFDTLTAEKESAAYQNILNIEMSVHRVTTFDEWKVKYKELQTEADMVIQSSTVAAMSDWDESAAERFAMENMKIPVGCVSTSVMCCSVFGLVKIALEQGDWAAKTALEVLDGRKPSQIPQTRNKQGQIMVNLELAELLDIAFDPILLKNAQPYGETK
jgi:ABC-type uncharacterized transport system substrate-binding protein